MFKRLFQAIPLIPALLLGCQSTPAESMGPPAAPAEVVLRPDQAVAVMRTMQDAVEPTHGQPSRLLPARGYRWSDVPRAVRSAGQQPTMGFAIVTSTVNDQQATFRVETIQGWPGWIVATQAKDAITFEVTMGPDPSHPAAQAQADRMEQALSASLQRWGRRPAWPALDGDAVTVDSQP